MCRNILLRVRDVDREAYRLCGSLKSGLRQAGAGHS
jgi:hypothetical protein